MTEEFAVVSASDSRYFSFLKGLILSIRDKPRLADVPIAILDLGLSPREREWLDARVQVRVRPEWDLDFPGRGKADESYKAFVARAFLPRYLPGFRIYLWMDADSWLQREEALGFLVEAAGDGSLAICPEADVGYTALFDGTLGRFLAKIYRRSFGRRDGRRLLAAPPLNSGVFALRADAPHWEAWQKALASVLKRNRDPYTDQVSLTRAVYDDRLPARFLPATFNWACGLGLPAVDLERRLAHPCPPHACLHVVHLTGPTKWAEQTLATVGGDTLTRSLRYGAASP